jgi:hypothetical protein
MDKKECKNALKLLTPTEEQSEKMWQNLIENQSSQKKKNDSYLMKFVAVAMAVVLVSISGFGVNAATGGKLVSTIKEFVTSSQSSEDIIKQAEKIGSDGIEVYAPEIMYLDEDLLIFGNLRGVILYDLQKKEVYGTIDIQAIDCIYFNSDSKQTCVVKEGKELLIFNTHQGTPYGNYYRYNIEKIEEVECSDDIQTMEKAYQIWTQEQEKKVDTFDEFCQNDEVNELFSNDKENLSMYSEKSTYWTDSKGEDKISFLTVQDEGYELYTYETDKKSFLETAIALEVDTQDTDTQKTDTQDTEQIEQTLPKFVYTGEDTAIQAICEYLAETEGEDDENSVWIPSFVIFKEVKSKGEYLVFGNFWSDSYKLTGNILESTGGGEMPACFHLIKSGEGYQVVSVEQAGDGTNYSKDIKNFTKGYWGLYRKYMDYEAIQEARDKAQKEYLQMYVRDNQLDIKYFKEFGWDPVEIFEEK